jgi:hypothetical protein
MSIEEMFFASTAYGIIREPRLLQPVGALTPGAYYVDHTVHYEY